MDALRPPKILIVDDLFGRSPDSGVNVERLRFCGQYLLLDETGDHTSATSPYRVKKPIARAVFCRGQTPSGGKVGNVVENAMPRVLDAVSESWGDDVADAWSMVLVDLCFYTGPITTESNERTNGMPVGRPADSSPSEYFGLRILQELRLRFPQLPTAVLSSMSREEVSLDLARYGACGFMERDAADAAAALAEFLDRHGLIHDQDGFVVGRSVSLLTALRSCRRAAQVNGNVLLKAERGSGKELLARYLNRRGRGGATRPIVAVNSAVLTAELYASELYGIERGVATGVDSRVGLFRTADGGDLFLDEIRDMVPQAQAGILRALESRSIVPVGAVAALPIDVRVISATNSDIDTLAAAGAFRPDLLDRLREAGTITLPPLRDRRADIGPLAYHFLRESEGRVRGALRREIDREALDMLRAYDWPGNIRELRSVIVDAVVHNPDVEHLVANHLSLMPGASSDSRSSASILGAGTGRMSNESTSDRAFRGTATLRESSLRGSLRDLRSEFAARQLELLEDALHLFADHTESNSRTAAPLLPAVRLLLADTSISTTQAADTVKKILAVRTSGLQREQLSEALQWALDTAMRVRPPRK